MTTIPTMIPVNSGLLPKPLVGRIWRGRTRAEDADTYLAYCYREGVCAIEKKPGCLGVQYFRELQDGIAHFTVISFWETIEAMHAMHTRGGDPLRVWPLPLDSQYLLELPEFVTLTELHSASSLHGRAQLSG
jgi:quinol monooxygenase YgiN